MINWYWEYNIKMKLSCLELRLLFYLFMVIISSAIRNDLCRPAGVAPDNATRCLFGLISRKEIIHIYITHWS